VLSARRRAAFDRLTLAFQAWVPTVSRRDGINEKLIRQWVKGHKGLEYLGSGQQRMVVGVPEGALKLTYGSDPSRFRRANLNESRIWHLAPPTLRERLVPVLDVASDSSWLLMERVKIWPEDVRLSDTIGRAELSRLSACGLLDLHAGNFDVDGRLVDYGLISELAWQRCLGEAERERRTREGSAVVDPAIRPQQELELLVALTKLRKAVQQVFACDTAFGPCKLDRPSTGHCMLVAMIVQDRFGGCVLAGEVNEIPHYWNRLEDQEGQRWQADLTGDQFGRPPIQFDKQLYPGGLVFHREPGVGLVLPLNEEIMVCLLGSRSASPR